MIFIAYIAITGVTTSSISMRLDDLAGPFIGGRTLNWTCGAWYGTNYTTDPNATSSPVITAVGLSSNTLYTITCDAYRTSDGQFLASFQVQQSTSQSQRPTNWSWTSTELAAFNNSNPISQRYTSALTYSRWNSFCNKVNEFRMYKNLSTLSSSAFMTFSDKTLTASRFNLVLTAINQMYSSGLVTKSTGEVVYGGYFTIMSNALNSIA